MKNHIPMSKAWMRIALSVVIVQGVCGLALLYYRHLQEKQQHDPAYQIIALVQTSPEAEGLKTIHLAELLDLSVDHPQNLYKFNSKEARQKLLSCPVIKEAVVRKIRPRTVHVDYTLRKPLAFLADYTNIAIDAEGYTFPFKPFFTPKKLPEFYLGVDEASSLNSSDQVSKGVVIEGDRINLAFDLFRIINASCLDESASLSRIDVSKAFALSYGQKQIVVVFEERVTKQIDGRPMLIITPQILRLGPDNYQQQLANYLVLREHLRKKDVGNLHASGEGAVIRNKPMVIDLRLSDLAFLSN